MSSRWPLRVFSFLPFLENRVFYHFWLNNEKSVLFHSGCHCFSYPFKGNETEKAIAKLSPYPKGILWDYSVIYLPRSALEVCLPWMLSVDHRMLSDNILWYTVNLFVYQISEQCSLIETFNSRPPPSVESDSCQLEKWKSSVSHGKSVRGKPWVSTPTSGVHLVSQ